MSDLAAWNVHGPYRHCGPNLPNGIHLPIQRFIRRSGAIAGDGGPISKSADEVLLYDDEHRLSTRVIFTRDSAGRVTREEAKPGVQKELEDAPPAAREAIMAALAASTTYAYDGLESAKETSGSQSSRFEYKYDTQGNWTERVGWSRLEPSANFERSNAERRGITYLGYLTGLSEGLKLFIFR